MIAVAAIAPATTARALDAAARTVALPTQSKDPAQGKVIDRELRSALQQLDAVELLPQPPLDLEAVQLAIDCLDESARCLGEVVRRMEAQILVAATIEHAGEQTVLRVLYFDVKGDAEPRSAERRVDDGEPEQKLLDAIPKLVRELFGGQAEAAPSEPLSGESAPALPEPVASAEHADGSSRPLPLGPLLLGGGGLAAIGAGLIVGALMKSTEEDYAARPVQDAMQAQLADQDRERGKQQAVIANVLLGTGVAAAVAAGIWLGVDLESRESSPQAALVPAVGKGSAGLALVGTWEDRP